MVAKPQSPEQEAVDITTSLLHEQIKLRTAQRDAWYRVTAGVPVLCLALSIYLVCAGAALLFRS